MSRSRSSQRALYSLTAAFCGEMCGTLIALAASDVRAASSGSASRRAWPRRIVRPASPPARHRGVEPDRAPRRRPRDARPDRRLHEPDAEATVSGVPAPQAEGDRGRLQLVAGRDIRDAFGPWLGRLGARRSRRSPSCRSHSASGPTRPASAASTPSSSPTRRSSGGSRTTGCGWGRPDTRLVR